ncbi:MAG: hypothetical protein N2Z21_09680 [Candidatus Sumerlaeaceae bacterium]|nr:hypothetical protein [Candidatus Sumerlaeaceae bacterium]
MKFRLHDQRVWVALVAAALVTTHCICFAKMTAPQVVPAKAANVVSVPDLNALQKAWKENSLKGVVEKVVEIAGGKEALATFESFLPQIEKELGFSLDGEAMATMVSGFDIFMTQATADGPPAGGAVASIGDKEKFQRFVAYWEKAAMKAASEAAEDENTSEPEKRQFITTETLSGEIVKHFTTAKGIDVYYVQTSSMFLVGSDKEMVSDMIARASGKQTKGGFASATDFEKVDKALTAHPGVIYMYQNPEAALSAPQKADELRKFSKFMRELTPFAMTGLSVQIEPKKIRSYKYAPFAAGTENLLLRKLMERAATSGKLDVLDFAPQQTMMVGVTNAFDAFFLYDMLRELTESLGGGSKDGNFEKQLKELEPVIGFSVKDDLLPSLGKQIGIFINNLDLSAGMFSLDAALVFEIRDKDKMQKVLTAVERMITDKAKTMMPQPPGEQKDQAPTLEISFKSTKEGDVSIRYLEIPPLPNVTPGYAFVGEYLIIGSSKETIQKLAAVKAGKEKGLAGSSALTQLGEVKPKGMSFGYMNFTAIWDTAEGIVTKMAPNPDAPKIMDALRPIKCAGGYGTVEEGAVIGEGVLILE